MPDLTLFILVTAVLAYCLFAVVRGNLNLPK